MTEEKDMLSKIMDASKELMTEKMPTTVPEHYGYSNTEFKVCVAEMLAALLIATNKSDAIDKIFPKQNKEEKFRLFAFAKAFQRLGFINKAEKEGEPLGGFEFGRI